MNKFKIVRSFYKTSYTEIYKFQAKTLDLGKSIFGAEAEVRRDNVLDQGWSEWKPSWGSCNKDNYQAMLPSFLAIEKAMKLCKKLAVCDCTQARHESHCRLG